MPVMAVIKLPSTDHCSGSLSHNISQDIYKPVVGQTGDVLTNSASRGHDGLDRLSVAGGTLAV